jgi:Bacterial Ig-like domain (group 2)
MRDFNKLDRSVSLSLLFACVLTVIAACVAPSGPLGAPNVIQTGTVSSVRLTLAQSTLAPGQTTQATAVAASADGTVVGGRVDFSSQNPSIATVSSNGVVTALTAGAAMIQAAVGSRVASANVTVESPVSPVAVVAVALDSTTLGIGHAAKATAVAKDAGGNVIPGQAVIWASLSPTIATVSSTGAVMAIAPGSATIKGTISGTSGSASVTVVQFSDSVILVSHDFNDGTIGPFNNNAGTDLDFVDDPTSPVSSRGKVARFYYLRPTTDGSVRDVNRSIEYVQPQRYGQSMFFKGDFYIPVDDLGNGLTSRKLLYFFPHVDFKKYGGIGSETFWTVITAQGSTLQLDVTSTRQDGTNGGFAVNLGTIAPRTWYTLEIEQRMNSSISATDGIVRVWLNGALLYENTTVTWTDPNWLGNTVAGAQVLDPTDVYFERFDFGDQVNSRYTYNEYRYWDNVAFSSKRIGQ